MPPEEGRHADIVIVGAGLAGAAAATVFGHQACRVVLIDPHLHCPPVFKAEKIEPDQAESMAALGLGDILASASRIREVLSYSNGNYLGTMQITQYAMRYDDMVNSLLEKLPAGVDLVLGRAFRIYNSDESQLVITDAGEKVRCRLVVLASGLNADLLCGLQLRRVCIQKHQSVATGFDVMSKNGAPFNFDAMTYSVADPNTGIDYISFFRMGETMRANLFAFVQGNCPWMLRFVREPNRLLPMLVPKLGKALGDYQILGPVVSGNIHLYRTEGHKPDGVVLIGDAAQNVCPSTGMGLSKILTDIEVLSDCVPSWFSSAGMGKDKLRQYFEHDRKRSTDAQAVFNAHYRRNACTARTARWRIHRARLRIQMELGRVQQRLSGRVQSSRAA